jgi:steroid delta-isomerase-like uncharacterized protein
MDNRNELLTRQLHDYFSKNLLDQCLAMTEEDVQVVAHPFGVTLRGRNEFLNFMQTLKNAFPDMIIMHTNIVSKGNKVAVEFTGSGTHTGPLSMPHGIIEPTGKRVVIRFSEFHLWENGKLNKIVNYQDSGSLLKQLEED